MIYEINNLPNLESTISGIIDQNKKIAQEAQSLDQLITSLQKANPNIKDLDQILQELIYCKSTLEEAIIPTNNKYAETMNKLIEQAKNNQKNTL